MRQGARVLPALLLLCSGTSIALYAQLVTNTNAIHPSSQILAWTKYFASCFIFTVLQVSQLGGKKQPLAPKPAKGSKREPGSVNPETWCFLMGLLDVFAYGLNGLGFPICGSALSMVIFAASGQVFTALTRVLLLGKHMSDRQQTAVAIVIIGLIVRGAPWKLYSSDSTNKPWSKQGSNLGLGVGYLVGSAAGYSLLGVMYEKLYQLPDNHLTHPQVNLRMSAVGLLALSLYQALYTWPNRQQLLVRPMKSSGVSASSLGLMLAGFGGEMLIQKGMPFADSQDAEGMQVLCGRVLERSGALAVSIVNALRAATVTVASAALYCSPTAPNQCLSVEGLASAIIISCGVALWSLPSADKDSKKGSTKSGVGGATKKTD